MSSEPVRARVLMVGQGPTAQSAFSSLARVHQLVGLLRTDEPGDPVTAQARAAGVPVHGDVSIDRLRAVLHETRPDCVVVSSFDRILPADLLEVCPFVNVHYSPLPEYRGRANVNWAVINGETHAAISIHELVAGLDAGGLLHQERVPITARTTLTQLYEQLNQAQDAALGAAVARLLSGDRGAPQDEAAASYGCARLPDDGELDWHRGTAALDRLVRGLTPPAPGAFTYLGVRRLWVDQAEPTPSPPRYDGRVPGRVVGVSRPEGWVDVLTGDGLLRLHRLRLEDGPAVPASRHVTSVKTTLGLQTADLLRELSALRSQLQDLQERSGPEGLR